MKYLLAGILILSLSLGIFAQDCSTYNDCKDCTTDRNCGWCGPVAKCWNGTRAGPSSPNVCYGESWYNINDNVNPHPCPNCSALFDCKSCMAFGEDCAWCKSSSNPTGGSCKEWGVGTIGCQSVDACPCNVYAACSDCIMDPYCYWCNNGAGNGTCNNNGAFCGGLTAHTCPCSDNIDCGSCLTDISGGCSWCETSNGGSCQASNTAGCFVALTCNAFCATEGTSCQTCNNLLGCGWCSSEDICVDVSTSACSGPLRHNCPNCAEHHYCDPCLDDGCAWCESGECRDKSNLNGCLVAHSCFDYCSVFTQCGQCSEAQGCGWCEDSKSCVDADTSSCFFAHSCADESSCGFDGGAFVGGMFLGIGVCAIAVGGYLFYRWKMAKKPGYSELH